MDRRKPILAGLITTNTCSSCRPFDHHGDIDDRSVAANNTSAFNCRATAGGSSWSERASGGKGLIRRSEPRCAGDERRQ